MNGAVTQAAAICLGAAALEGLFSGRGAKHRLAELRQPRYSPPFRAWVAIGVGYYLICFVVLFRLLATAPSTRRSVAVAAVAALLIVNALWNLVFFRWKRLAASFAILAAYGILAVLIEALLAALDSIAASVFLLYLLYLGYAAWWLRSLLRLNRDGAGEGPR